MSDVKKLLSKTHLDVGLVDDDRQIVYARDMGGFSGWMATTFGDLEVSNFRAIVKGKRLISNRLKIQPHH